MPQQLDDGTEVLTREEYEAELRGIKSNRDAALAEKKAAQEELKRLAEQWGDLNPDEVRSTLKAQRDGKKQKAAADGDLAAIEKSHQAEVEQLKAAHKKELDSRQAREHKLMSTVERSLVEAELTRAIADQKGDAKLLLPHARNYVKVKETDDGFSAYVVDENGHPMLSDGQGSPMSFDQLVEQKLIAQYPRAFDGTGSSGSGASKSAGGASGAKVVAADDNSAFIANLEGIASGSVTVR